MSGLGWTGGGRLPSRRVPGHRRDTGSRLAEAAIQLPPRFLEAGRCSESGRWRLPDRLLHPCNDQEL